MDGWMNGWKKRYTKLYFHKQTSHRSSTQLAQKQAEDIQLT